MIPLSQVKPDESEALAVAEAMSRVLVSGRYILGEEVAAFEREWAAYCGARHCIGVASGTDAIKLLLAGLTPGSRVLTVANTAPPTYTAIREAELEPHFVEVGEDGLLNPHALPEVPRWDVSALLPVHLYGRMCRMAPLVEYAAKHRLRLVEDACQAHGAVDVDGVRPGELSAGAAFSFYPTKNLACLGDGGAIVTNDDALAEQTRRLRQYGYVETGILGPAAGCNSRLDELQAAVLRARLPHLEQHNARRVEAVQVYLATLAEMGLPAQVLAGGNCHFMVVRFGWRERNLVRVALDARGIGNAVHYPRPGNRQRPFLGGSCLPITQALCDEVLTLPLWPGMEVATIERVCLALRAALEV